MKTKKHKTKSKKGHNKSKKGYKKGILMQAIDQLIQQKGSDVTYEEMEMTAKKVKPDTAFNRNHFHWYLQHFGVTKAKAKAKGKGTKKAKVKTVKIKKRKVA